MNSLTRRLFRRAKTQMPTRRCRPNVQHLERRDTPAPFGPANLVVYRVGDGTQPLANTGNSVFLDEYTTSGVLVQSIKLNDGATGTRLIASGTSTAEGGLSLSPDGKFLAMAGYDAAFGGTTSLPGSASTVTFRSAAIVDANGNQQYAKINDAFSANSPRGAVTNDGTSVYMVGASSGVRYVSNLAATTSLLINTGNPTNNRVLNIFGGQLYLSSGAAGFRIATVGNGVPTTGGQTTTNLPGDSSDTTKLASPYGFFLADLNPTVNGAGPYDTLYAADDSATTPGIRKFSFNALSGLWEAKGAITGNGNGSHGLTGHVRGNCVDLYYTNSPSAGGSLLLSVSDTSGYGGMVTGTPTVLATAGNTSIGFRGVAFTPQITAPPEVVSISQPAPMVSNSANYTITFNTPITGLTTGNLAIVTTGDVTVGSVGTPTTIDGLTWNVPINGISGDGTLRLDLVNQTGISPTLFFMPFNCGIPAIVNNTPLSATLDFVNGAYVYSGGAGKDNNVNLAVNNGSYSLNDTLETITITPAAALAGWTGNGTNNVSNPNGGTIGLLVKLGAGTDVININALDVSLSALGGGNAGDQANLAGNIKTTGAISLTGFDNINHASPTPIGVGALTMSANSVGAPGVAILTQATSVTALAGAGGVFLQELDGASFTVQATGAGVISVSNVSGTLSIDGDSKWVNGSATLSSGDGVVINAAFGDGNSAGPITINANTNGFGTEGYFQSKLGRLQTSDASNGAISITVNTMFGGFGSAVLGTGAAGGASTVSVNTFLGSILWSPELTIPALNTGNTQTLSAGNFNFMTNGPDSAVGSQLSPLQLSSLITNGLVSVPFAGIGGIYITEWGAQNTKFSGTANGSGNVQFWTGNATNNGIELTSPGVTTGSGYISLRADDNLLLNAPVGGPGFSGTVFLEANLDGASSQEFSMSGGLNSITTSNTSATAVVIQAYSVSDGFGGGNVGGVTLGNISTGNGGIVTINAAALIGGGNPTDALRAGAIFMLPGSLVDTGGGGGLIMTAKDNPIGTPTSPIVVNAKMISAITNSVATSGAGTVQMDGSIWINSNSPADFSAVTTTAGSMVGTITLSTANGRLGIFGDLRTTDGAISLNTPGFILQTGGTIITTGALNLNYTGSAVITTQNNSVGILNLSPGQNFQVIGSLATATPITFDGGGDLVQAKLSGTGKISDINLTNFAGLSPGNSPGILGSGNITWSGGSRFSCEISGGSAGTGYDQLQVTGTVDIGNATLDISDPTLLYAPAPGAKHFLILNDGIDPIANNFKAFPEGATVTINSINYTISYVGNGDGGGVGNDVVLTAPGVPVNPPTVSGSVVVNGGSQRSMVQSLVITFSEAVTLAPGAFKVDGTALGPIGAVGLNVSQVGSSVTLTFNSSGVAIDPLNSLKDGKYKLTIVAANVSGAGGTLDGNGNMVSQGSPADDVTFEFHRLFGDGNGDGSVTASDFNDFRLFYGNLASGLKYDFDGGGVTASDFNQFRTRYGLSGYLP